MFTSGARWSHGSTRHFSKKATQTWSNIVVVFFTFSSVFVVKVRHYFSFSLPSVPCTHWPREFRVTTEVQSTKRKGAITKQRNFRKKQLEQKCSKRIWPFAQTRFEKREVLTGVGRFIPSKLDIYSSVVYKRGEKKKRLDAVKNPLKVIRIIGCQNQLLLIIRQRCQRTLRVTTDAHPFLFYFFWAEQ